MAASTVAGTDPHAGLSAFQIRKVAHDKVRPPAFALIILHSIGLLTYLAATGANLLELVRARDPGVAAANLAVNLLILGLSAFIVFGAFQMLHVRRYGFALAAAILSIIHCNPCCFLSIGFGIWAIVMLVDPVVKRGFAELGN